MSSSTFAKPSAFLPLAMSGAALATVLVHILFYGTARETDEGAAAHIFQLLIICQVPIVVVFAVKCLQRTPKQALVVLGLQVVAVAAAFAPVFYFNL